MGSTPRSTRREFLRGRAAADALASLVDSVAAPPPESTSGVADQCNPPGDVYLLHYARRAMACEFEFVLNAGQYPQAAAAAIAGLDLVERLEDQLTVYRPTSEISRLNASAAAGPFAVEPGLFALLRQAAELHAATHGAFDVTAAPLSEAWGFTRRAGVLPSPEDLADALARVGSQWLEFDDLRHAIVFRQAGVQINLGAIGKGFALDRAAELLMAEGVQDFLLHGGNSSVVARGTHGSLPSGQGWLVGVRNPQRPEQRLGQLRVVDQALATSGSGTQFFVHAGRTYGHIIDPRTGWPADGVLSATVLADRAATTDALSTAFYVLGPQGAADYCATHPDVGCLLVCPGQRAGSVEIHEFGLAPGQWQPFQPGTA